MINWEGGGESTEAGCIYTCWIERIQSLR